MEQARLNKAKWSRAKRSHHYINVLGFQKDEVESLSYDSEQIADAHHAYRKKISYLQAIKGYSQQCILAPGICLFRAGTQVHLNI